MPEDKKDIHRDKNKYILSDRSLLKKDSNSYFVFKKGGKLVAALYLVTESIPSEEVLRSKIRSCGIDVLSFIAHQRDETNYREQYIDLRNTIAELLSLLEVGVLGGYISPMNREVLDREYRELLSLATNAGNYVTRSPHFHEDFFTVEGESTKIDETDEPTEMWRNEMWSIFNKRHFKGHTGSGQTSDPPAASTGSSKTKIPRAPKGQTERGSRGDRRSAIVAFIEQKGRVSVKDVVGAITGCSEKTLQRELLALVEEGVLKKEGERRWSTYLLAQS